MKDKCEKDFLIIKCIQIFAKYNALYEIEYNISLNKKYLADYTQVNRILLWEFSQNH